MRSRAIAAATNRRSCKPSEATYVSSDCARSCRHLLACSVVPARYPAASATAMPTLTTDRPPTIDASHTTSRASLRTDFHIGVLPRYLPAQPRLWLSGSVHSAVLNNPKNLFPFCSHSARDQITPPAAPRRSPVVSPASRERGRRPNSTEKYPI